MCTNAIVRFASGIWTLAADAPKLEMLYWRRISCNSVDVGGGGEPESILCPSKEWVSCIVVNTHVMEMKDIITMQVNRCHPDLVRPFEHTSARR